MSNFYRTGRGGAGNFQYSSPSNDLKAGLSSAEAQATQELAAAVAAAAEKKEADPTQEEPEYATFGRGGGGNWYRTAEAKKEKVPRVEDDNTSETPVGKRVWMGRGGAGNYAGSAEEVKKQQEMKDMDLNERERMVKNEVAQKVDMVLERPGRAHVSVSSKIRTEK